MQRRRPRRQRALQFLRITRQIQLAQAPGTQVARIAHRAADEQAFGIDAIAEIVQTARAPVGRGSRAGPPRSSHNSARHTHRRRARPQIARRAVANRWKPEGSRNSENLRAQRVEMRTGSSLSALSFSCEMRQRLRILVSHRSVEGLNNPSR